MVLPLASFALAVSCTELPSVSEGAAGDRISEAGVPPEGVVTSAAPPPPQPVRVTNKRPSIEKTRMIQYSEVECR
jgi:hypothetical protein